MYCNSTHLEITILFYTKYIDRILEVLPGTYLVNNEHLGEYKRKHY